MKILHASTRREPFGRTIAEALACGDGALRARLGEAARRTAGKRCSRERNVSEGLAVYCSLVHGR